MDIKVGFDRGKVTISPDVAHVKVGDSVRWVCTGVTAGQQQWTLKFRAKSPFRAHSFAGLSPRPGGRSGGSAFAEMIQYQVAVEAGVAETRGDYKYDVALTENGKPIYDIDPQIIVR